MAANEDLIDRWSTAHFVGGFVLGCAGLSYPTFLTVHVTYDLAEQFVERTRFGQELFETNGPENLLNIAGDTVIASVGWLLATELFNRR